MKLREYLTKKGIIHKFFAEQINVTPQQLSTYLANKVKPSLPVMLEIEKITNKEVTIYDWLNTETKTKKQSKNSTLQ